LSPGFIVKEASNSTALKPRARLAASGELARSSPIAFERCVTPRKAAPMISRAKQSIVETSHGACAVEESGAGDLPLLLIVHRRGIRTGVILAHIV
jgi:hypothetical protein